MIYYVLKQMLPECYFTVMGDVSQNIRYETGMNDWEGLEKASQGAYRIQPVIRHRKPAEIHTVPQEQLPELLRRTVRQVTDHGYETVAVICRTEEEAAEVRELLEIAPDDSSSFHNGVMVLPVTLTKGLEFDTVILWKPDEEHYGNNARKAKLLYVAITRALHELYLLGDKEISLLMR